MRRTLLLLLGLATLGACSDQPTAPAAPEAPPQTSAALTVPPPSLREGPLSGPVRPFGARPSLGQSAACPSRCPIWLDKLPAGATVTHLNNSARVLGHDATGAFYWSLENGVKRVGTLGGRTLPTYITDWSYVVGESVTSGGAAHAFWWTNWGGAKDLGTLGGPVSRAYAATDDAAQIVGRAQTSDGKDKAFLYTSAGMRNLGTLGGVSSGARDINGRGEVVGWARNAAGAMRGFLWTAAAGMKDLGSLSGVPGDIIAAAVNENGQVAGNAGSRAFFWTPATGMRDLGTLGGSRSEAVDLSDAGEVVGNSVAADGRTYAFVWTAAGGMVKLETLGGTGSRALAINSWGDILGTITRTDGTTRPAVWTWEGNQFRYGAFATPPAPPPPATKPVITITFDDGWESTYTRAYPILQKYGLVGNVGVVTVAVDYWTGFMTLAQLRTLEQNGWAMVSHTVDHPHLPQVSETELDRQLRVSQQWLRDRGFRMSNVIIIPYHDWGARELTAVKKYYQAARGYTSNYFVPERFQRYPADDPYELTSVEPEYYGGSFTTPEGREALRRKLDEVVANGYFIDVFFHDITASQAAAFEETVKILAAYKAHVKTWRDLYPG